MPQFARGSVFPNQPTQQQLSEQDNYKAYLQQQVLGSDTWSVLLCVSFFFWKPANLLDSVVLVSKSEFTCTNLETGCFLLF